MGFLQSRSRLTRLIISYLLFEYNAPFDTRPPPLPFLRPPALRLARNHGIPFLKADWIVAKSNEPLVKSYPRIRQICLPEGDRFDNDVGNTTSLVQQTLFLFILFGCLCSVLSLGCIRCLKVPRDLISK